MEISSPSYYDRTKLTNTSYFLQLFLKTYLGRLLFRNNSSRVVFASDEYCYRQRLNELAAQGVSSDLYLDLPFMNFWRESNWVPSDRPAMIQASPMIEGITDGAKKVYFMNAMATFHCTCHFSRDDDAQLAYETLIWLQQPSEKQYQVDGLVYNSSEIPLPVSIKTENIQFNPTFKENDWLKSNRVVPVSFDLTLYSAIFKQLAQGSESPLFPQQDTTVYITNRVLLDFLSYTQDPLLATDNYELEVENLFNPETETAVSIGTVATTNTTITFTWVYDNDDVALLQPNVRVYIKPDEYVEVPTANKTYTFTGLQPGSQYPFAIWFFFVSGTVAKRESTGTTTSTGVATPNLKGMIGYTF